MLGDPKEANERVAIVTNDKVGAVINDLIIRVIMSLSITGSNAPLIVFGQFSRPFPLRKLLIAPLFARPQHRLKLFPFFLLPLHCKDLVLRHSEPMPFCGSARGSVCLLTAPTVLSVRPLSVVLPPNASGC